MSRFNNKEKNGNFNDSLVSPSVVVEKNKDISKGNQPEQISDSKTPRPIFNRPVSQEDIEKYNNIDPNAFYDENEKFLQETKRKSVIHRQKMERLKNEQERLLASFASQYHPQVFDNRPQQTTGQDFTNVGSPHYLDIKPGSKTTNLQEENSSYSSDPKERELEEKIRRNEEEAKRDRERLVKIREEKNYKNIKK